MKIKASFQYMMSSALPSFGIFYGILVAVYALGFTMVSTLGGHGSIGGVEASNAIFVFVLGLNAFKDYFGMLLQNGVSRKTMFAGRLLSFGAIAVISAILSYLLSMAMNWAAYSLNMRESTSFFNTMYNSDNGALSFLFSVVLFFMLQMIGYCITTLFYHLNRMGKILVGAGVPLLFAMVLPIVDTIFFDNQIIFSFGRFISFIMGFSNNQPLIGIATFTAISIVTSIIGWVLTRHATVKR